MMMGLIMSDHLRLLYGGKPWSVQGKEVMPLDGSKAARTGQKDCIKGDSSERPGLRNGVVGETMNLSLRLLRTVARFLPSDLVWRWNHHRACKGGARGNAPAGNGQPVA